MLNSIWAFIIIIAVITGFITGNLSLVAKAVIEGASDGVTLVLGMLGVMCFWTGIMEIAEKGGVMRFISSLLRPVTKLLFKNLNKNEPAMGAIVMNMAANLLGMGNAATPLGLRAMQLLDEKNGGRKKASHEMCMFVLINTASIQLIPTTVILLRQNMGSVSPGEIILPVWLVSVAALLVGVLSIKLFRKAEKK